MIERDRVVENLQCLTNEEHISMHNTKYYEDKTMICPVCKKEFVWSKKSQRSHKARSDKGPFCSSRCALRYASTKRKIAPLHNPQDYGVD